MAQLDKSKPHGEVFGDDPVRRFEQNGKYFDAKGDEVGADGKVTKTVIAPAKADEKKAEPTSVDAQLAKQ